MFWNIKTRNPPPLEEFYNDRDDQKTREEKKLWWIEKSREKFYDMNAEILAYCVLDTRILIMSLAAFLRQSYDFGNMLIRRYGNPAGWNPTMFPYFSPFHANICTLGSYG